MITHWGGQEEITGNLNNAKQNLPQEPLKPERNIGDLQTSGTVMYSVQEQGTF